MGTLVRGEPFAKRLSMPIDFRFDITQYGKSNLYPQLVEQIMFRSATTSAATDGLHDFVFGEGFSMNGDMIINRHEQTLNDILNLASRDYSTYGGFSLHFNVDELFNITEINYADFKLSRFGLPDRRGIHHDIKMNMNWEKDPYKMVDNTEKVFTFPMWQRRDGSEFNDLENGIEDFRGFMLYWTPAPDQYPKCKFDPVMDSAQTDAEIQMFELGNIQNGFLGASIMKLPVKMEGDAERRQMEYDLMQLQGSENANSILMIETPPDFEGNIIENVAANNNDALFTQTTENVVQRIMNNYGMPFPVAGLQPTQGGVFNSEQIGDSMRQYNMRTRGDRMMLARVFNQFMGFWADGAVDVGEINQLTFVDSTDESDLNTSTTKVEGESEGEDEEAEPRIEKSQRTPEELASQANLRGSVGGVQGILSIQAAVAAGTTDFDAAVTILVEVYGFAEPIAIDLLGKRTEELSDNPETEEDGGNETDN